MGNHSHHPHRYLTDQGKCAACESNGKGMAWIIGIIFSALFLFWPLFLKPHLIAWITEGVWLGGWLAILITAILVKANSREVRQREQEEYRR